MSAIQAAVDSGALLPSDVRPQLLDSCLHTPPGCPDVDLVIRTSGETRLSDFMLWQVGAVFMRSMCADVESECREAKQIHCVLKMNLISFLGSLKGCCA